jgi:hypothetical protein
MAEPPTTKNFMKIYLALQKQKTTIEKPAPADNPDNRILLLQRLDRFIATSGGNITSLAKYPIDWKHAPVCDQERRNVDVGANAQIPRCRRLCPIDDGTVMFVKNRSLDKDDPKAKFLDNCPSHPTDSMIKLNKTGSSKPIDKIHQDLEKLADALKAISLSLAGQPIAKDLEKMEANARAIQGNVNEIKTS